MIENIEAVAWEWRLDTQGGSWEGLQMGTGKLLWVTHLFTIFPSDVCRCVTFTLKLNKLHTPNMGSLSITLQFKKKNLGVITKRS